MSASPAVLAAHRAAQHGDWGTCLSAADEAIRTDPKTPEGLFLAGVALLKLDHLGVALHLFHAARQLGGERPEFLNNIGCALQERHPEEALKALLRANTLAPDSVDTLTNLVNVTSSLGRHAEAIAWAERCSALHGIVGDAAYNASFAYFSLGQWEAGWKAYNKAMSMRPGAERTYHADRQTPRWNPTKRAQARLVIHGEQGIGDEIMFASLYDQAIKDAGGDVILECSPRLEGLFKRSFPECRVYGTLTSTETSWPLKERPEAHIEAGGLGEWYAPLPFRRDAYLKACPERREMWRAYLNHHEPVRQRLRVGLAWTGGTPADRAQRSISRDQLEPILAVPGVQFVSLEYEDHDPIPGVLDPKRATRKGQDIDELAALVSELDLVIAVTTSVVDLCGALGKPVWALAPRHPPWRYAVEAGEKQMWWYESARVFRQPKDTDKWGSTVARVAKELRQWGS